MGEPRDSYGSAENSSARDNFTKDKKSSNPTEKGLTQQVINLNTLDKRDNAMNNDDHSAIGQAEDDHS